MDFHVMVRAMLIGSKMPGKNLLVSCGRDIRKKNATQFELDSVFAWAAPAWISKERHQEPPATSRSGNSAQRDNSRPGRYSSN